MGDPLRFRSLRKHVLLFATCFLILASPAVAGAQWVTIHDPIYQATFSKPSAGAAFTDPKFGTSVRRLTDARGGGIASIVPQYSKRQAWNADQSFLLLFTGDGTGRLYDGTTYEFLRPLDDVGGEDVFWHPTNPDLLYFSFGNTLFSYNVITQSPTAVRTFDGYTWINTRGEGNLSRDGRYYAFVGQTYDTDTHFKDIVVYDLILDSIVSRMVLPAVLSDFDWASISPLGNYVVVDYATADTGRYQGIEVYDRNLNFIWQKGLGAGHSDLAVDENGNEVLVMAYYDADLNRGFVKKFRLADGATTSLMELSPDFDLHISCRNESRREWCFISTFDAEGRLTDDSLSWLPFEDEIFALKMDGSGDVQRIAHHHSKRFSPSTPDRDNSNYWAEPHATVSRDGTRMIFGSNWRENIASDSSVDAYVVDFRSFLGIKAGQAGVSSGYELLQNYPNPFNPTTAISYELSANRYVMLKVYDVLGREVATLVNGRQNAGSYTVIFDGRGFPSGVYICRMCAGSFSDTRKMVLVK
jgi:Secretion system C-terminal sorting domain